MLCQDCDAVFHKALHKRSHIRLSRASVEESYLYAGLRNALKEGMSAEWQAIFQESAPRPSVTKSPIALWTLVGALAICLRFVLDGMKVTRCDTLLDFYRFLRLTSFRSMILIFLSTLCLQFAPLCAC